MLGRQLLQTLRTDPESLFKRGATARQIATMEKKLGIVFPPSYREFLTSFNGGEFRFARMYRISKGGAGFFDLVEEMSRAKEAWEPFVNGRLLLFGDDYGRNYYCFDLSKTKSTGESPVVLWNASPTPRISRQAADLRSFIAKNLREA